MMAPFATKTEADNEIRRIDFEYACAVLLNRTPGTTRELFRAPHGEYCLMTFERGHKWVGMWFGSASEIRVEYEDAPILPVVSSVERI
jgi:hypothetical protein